MSLQAIEIFSIYCHEEWWRNKIGSEGICTWIIRKAKEAYRKGEEVEDGIFKLGNTYFLIEKHPNLDGKLMLNLVFNSKHRDDCFRKKDEIFFAYSKGRVFTPLHSIDRLTEFNFFSWKNNRIKNSDCSSEGIVSWIRRNVDLALKDNIHGKFSENSDASYEKDGLLFIVEPHNRKSGFFQLKTIMSIRK